MSDWALQASDLEAAVAVEARHRRVAEDEAGAARRQKTELMLHQARGSWLAIDATGNVFNCHALQRAWQVPGCQPLTKYGWLTLNFIATPTAVQPQSRSRTTSTQPDSS